MLNRRHFLTLAGACAAVVVGSGVTGCSHEKAAAGSGSSAAKRVGVLQLTQHAALDAAQKGFLAQLDASGLAYHSDVQNANNEQNACQTIAATFAGQPVDLIFAIATPAAQAAAATTQDIPIVATAITDFVAAGLAQSDDKPGGNVTGTSDLTPVARQIELAHRVLPHMTRMGILFCTAESNSELQAKLAEETLDKLGIEHERFTVSSSNEIQSVTENAVTKVDALYTPTDNTIAAGMAQIAQIALDARVPVVCGEKAHVEAGGLFSLSIDYEALGRKAGDIAVRILRGETTPANTPIEHLSDDDLELVTNKDVAQKLGIDLSALDA